MMQISFDGIEEFASVSQTGTESSKRYVFALAHVLRFGTRTTLKILMKWPTYHDLENHIREVKPHTTPSARSDYELLFTANWNATLEASQRRIDAHSACGVQVIPVLHGDYPALLRLIPDPPPILFVKTESIANLSQIGVAVVGTRNATPRGESVAKRVARFFGEQGFAIVSGLAKGIDTAAHEGAIESLSTTYAVFATALDKVYPAENRALAHKILDTGGAWLSEIPLGGATHRNTFIERDRIQSGLSAAIVPVQTDIKGGTMHTVGFAEKHGRILLCPKPLQAEHDREQYRGINHLIHSGRATPFDSGDYTAILSQVRERMRTLLPNSADEMASAGKTDTSVSARTQAPPLQAETVERVQALQLEACREDQLHLSISSGGNSALPEVHALTLDSSELNKLAVQKVTRAVISISREIDKETFDKLMSLVRIELFEKGPAKPKGTRRKPK